MKKRAFSADTLIEEAQAQLEAEGAGPSAARRGPLGNPESQPVQESVEGLGPDLRTDTWTTLGIDGANKRISFALPFYTQNAIFF